MSINPNANVTMCIIKYTPGVEGKKKKRNDVSSSEKRNNGVGCVNVSTYIHTYIHTYTYAHVYVCV